MPYGVCAGCCLPWLPPVMKRVTTHVQSYMEARKLSGALSNVETFGVSVLKSSCWPPLNMFANTILPPELAACEKHFKAYHDFHCASRTVRRSQLF